MMRPLSSERWTRIAAIFDAALALPPSDRADYVWHACGDDVGLRQEVESLMAQEGRESPLDNTPWVTPPAGADVRHRIGNRIGPYTIDAVLGAGGMGEVYRAQDPVLGRPVALKVVPRDWSSDAERLSRLRREAQALATLNHPHIATIYGVHVQEDATSAGLALVLEFVDGPTLAERLANGPVPVDDAIEIARQIAEALEAAHDQGIVHRDLKPANVKVRPDGTVKVLDFGLAKFIHAPLPAAEEPAVAATRPGATGVGVILGTPEYMSPEQATGQPIDRRSDIWAFGCVLYEMLTGRPAFAAGNLADTVGAVLRGDPDWSQLPDATPNRVRRLLRRCLTTGARQRLQHIGDARIELTDTALDEPRRTLPRRRAWPMVSAAIVLTIVGAILGASVWSASSGRRNASSQPPEVRLALDALPSREPVSFAVSPDGTQVVFSASAGASEQLWLRSLTSDSSRRLEGTEGARYPFWAPHSQSVAFFAGRALKRLDLETGVITVLAPSPGSFGGTWGRDDTILFAPTGGRAIQRVSASGGRAAPATSHEQGPGHRAPHFLPDSEHFLFYSAGTRAVYVAGPDFPARRLMDADAGAVYSASGEILFPRDGKLLAQSFDVRQRRLLGNTRVVADDIAVAREDGVAAMSVSSNGVLVYRSAVGTPSMRQLAWVDGSGTTVDTLGAADRALSVDPVLSPGGDRVALWRVQDSRPDVWLLDTAIGRRVRLPASNEGTRTYPVWSHDNAGLVFALNTGTSRDLVLTWLDNRAADRRLLSGGDNVPLDWSRDGKFVLYGRDGDLWALEVDGDSRPVPVATGPSLESQGQFSPDGRWVAYQSNEDGRFEIYVQAFPGRGERKGVSVDGGAQVRWHPEGRELFFIAPDGRLMASSVRRTSDSTLEFGDPRALFTTSVGGWLQLNFRQQYAVAKDGRFLMNTLLQDPSEAPIHVVVNLRPSAASP